MAGIVAGLSWRFTDAPVFIHLLNTYLFSFYWAPGPVLVAGYLRVLHS